MNDNNNSAPASDPSNDPSSRATPPFPVTLAHKTMATSAGSAAAKSGLRAGAGLLVGGAVAGGLGLLFAKRRTNQKKQAQQQKSGAAASAARPLSISKDSPYSSSAALAASRPPLPKAPRAAPDKNTSARKTTANKSKNSGQHGKTQSDMPAQIARAVTLILPLVAAHQERRRHEREKQDEHDKKKEEVVNVLKEQVEAIPASHARAPVATIDGKTRVQRMGQLCMAAVNAWLEDFAPSMGAAIAYYTIFSIAPMLVIAIAVAGMIFGQDAAQGEIVNQIGSIVGNEGAAAIQSLLLSVSKPTDGIIATALSVVTLAVGATAVFAELQSALDRIWRMPAIARKTGIWNLLRTRLLSFGLILGLGFVLIISLIVSAGLAAIGKWWGGWFEGWQIVLQLLNFVISFVVFAGLFSVIYKFMPRVTLSWHDVWIGSVVTTVLFIIGKYLIGLYLGRTGMASGFGAAGSFALLLAWIYYSAQIFLLGAEFTWIYANNFGSKAKRARRAEQARTPAPEIVGL
ncbi:YihY/virulence factor BrkB family protein [Herbaspirillum lusitanum]|uniref:YihY/virulence factor BrkB family protein n=1 Tax=Herbaspirillum lusitanum TaxID=213312 RepID=A0ABW9AE84_9BURK